MTELSFAKQFLSTLDSKPTKVSADHVEDPRSYPSRSAYILPKQPHPLQKRQKLTHSTDSNITVTLKSLRNPPLDISLPSLSPNTSILDLKTTIATEYSIPLSALRILYAKKPVADSKVLKDVLPAGGEEGERRLEFAVMVIGGAAVMKGREEEEVEVKVGSVAQGVSGREVMKSNEFWGDLKGFLVQRLRDEGEGERVFGVFRKAWEGER